MDDFIRVALIADSNGMVRAFGAASAAVSTLRSGMQKVQGIAMQLDQSIKRVGQVSLGMAASFAASIGLSTKAAAEFETQMRNVNSILQLSEKEFTRLSDAVLDLSQVSPKSANETAAALYEVASAGFEGAEAMEVTARATKAATAGMTDVGTAGRSIASVLNAYQLGAKEAADVSDVLFKTVEVGVLNFEDLALQLGDIVPLGQSLGISFDKLGAVMAALTQAGFPAAQAATSLAGVMRSFIKPSEAMTAIVQKMGFASAQAMLETEGLQGSLQMLHKETEGNTTAMAALFQDTEGLRGALALTANDGALLSNAMNEIANETNRAGATQRAYGQQSKTFNTAFEILKNNITAARVEIGDKFLPILTNLTSSAGGSVKAFADMPGAVHAVVAVFLAAGAAITGLVGALAFGAVRAALFGKVLKDNAIAQRLGIAGARSFTQVVAGMARSFDIAGRGVRGSQRVVDLFGRTANRASMPVFNLGMRLENLRVRSQNMGRVTGFAARSLATFGTALTSMGGIGVGAGARIDALSNKLIRLGQRLRQGERLTKVFSRGLSGLASIAGLAGTAFIESMLIIGDWNATAQEAKDTAKALAEEISQRHDTNSIEGLRGAWQEVREEAMAYHKATDFSIAGRIKGGFEVLSPFHENRKQMRFEMNEAFEEQERLARERIERFNKNMALFTRPMARISTLPMRLPIKEEDIKAVAESLGVDLSKALDTTEKHMITLFNTGGITRLEFARWVNDSDSLAGQMILSASATDETTYSMSILGTQLESLRSPIAEVTGQTVELTEAQKTLQSAMEAIGSATSAWDAALTKKRDFRQLFVDDQIKGAEEASERRIRQLEDESEARIEAKEAEVEAFKEGGRNRERAQDQLEDLRERESESLQTARDKEAEILAQSREDMQKTVEEQKLTLQERTDALMGANMKMVAFQQNAATIAARMGSDPELKGKADDVIGFLASLGEEGAVLAEELAKATPEQLKRFATEALNNIELTGAEMAVKMNAAFAVTEEAASLGAKATKDAIMNVLGILPDDMKVIMDEFGGVIESSLNRILAGAGLPPLSLVDPGVSMETAQGNPYTFHPARKARGDITPRIATNETILFGERSTGGESFIPLGPSHRARSIPLWEETGKRLGVLPMGNGGIVASSGPTITNNRTSKVNKTEFTGDMYLSDPRETLRYAERRKRLAGLTSGED